MVGSPMSRVMRCHHPPRSRCLAVEVHPRLHGPRTVVLGGLEHETPSAARHRSSSDIPTRDSIFDAHAGNAEAYYPHFQFDSNYTYGMVHRE